MASVLSFWRMPEEEAAFLDYLDRTDDLVACVPQPPEFLAWGRRVLSWYRRRTAPHHYRHRATPAAAAAAAAFDVELVT